ncbi:hypothetical protein C8K30_11554 [Promicromonospora sp. AC04]|uniref:hypothetical protein n=1 Tax=Promicromonospora sp. AC04 TaxID=2135723 RepID=UPI000D4C5988|nr:hypothetical protein [Promicromonospora sp. AC04]PUB20843.1 hypothetical protein C8K30_11554 [Promicromonospora sp. AC04]
MTRHHTLHAPVAGIRLAWPSATTIVLDPGPGERARTHNLARERYLLAGAVLMSVAGLVILQRSQPHDRPWTLAAGLLLGALACFAARPARRAVPPGLVELLEPLRALDPARPAEIHRLVWEAADLIETGETCDNTPACPDCADRVEQIHARLCELTRPGGPSGLHSGPARTVIEHRAARGS